MIENKITIASNERTLKCRKDAVFGENDNWSNLKRDSISLKYFHQGGKFDSIKPQFADFRHDDQEGQNGKPCRPRHHLVRLLHIDYAKDEDKLKFT